MAIDKRSDEEKTISFIRIQMRLALEVWEQKLYEHPPTLQDAFIDGFNAGALFGVDLAQSGYKYE